eukprot:TRINITY_DN1960_c0_g1_i3.p1 TRINITY_DN1960_c0_g1~~TRINITY_DN1960_c0_g1_i3.p1  ORF type:complete len:537 (+),score=75.16 TRINITY_DN1960_c0_g1_i3:36-1646(+)
MGTCCSSHRASAGPQPAAASALKSRKEPAQANDVQNGTSSALQKPEVENNPAQGSSVGEGSSAGALSEPEGLGKSLRASVSPPGLNLGKLNDPSPESAATQSDISYTQLTARSVIYHAFITPRPVATPRRTSIIYGDGDATASLVTYKQLTRTDYTILADIGKGSFGTVFLVRHTPTDTRYAVKQIEDLALRRTGADKLIKEVTMMTSIAHPNVVTLHALEFDPNSFSVWLLMEYVDGARNLGEIRAEHGEGVGEDRARRFLIQILEGLQAIHLAGIAHRDIKCENFVVDSSERLKITDFGLSCVQKCDGVDSQLLRTRCGTPNYMAPEVIFPEAGYDGFKADVWSVGVVLYGMLVGKLPFPSHSLPKLLGAVRDGDYTVPKRVGGDAADLIEGLMCAEPAQRLQVAEAFNHPWVLLDPRASWDRVEGVIRAPTTDMKKVRSLALATEVNDFFQRHGRSDRQLSTSVEFRDGNWLYERDETTSRQCAALSMLATCRPLRRSRKPQRSPRAATPITGNTPIITVRSPSPNCAIPTAP